MKKFCVEWDLSVAETPSRNPNKSGVWINVKKLTENKAPKGFKIFNTKEEAGDFFLDRLRESSKPKLYEMTLVRGEHE